LPNCRAFGGMARDVARCLFIKRAPVYDAIGEVEVLEDRHGHYGYCEA
jgi:hypothetical protein